MPLVRYEDGELGWIEESKAKPTDKRLWARARNLAHMDKEYNAFSARLVTKKIYQMLGGSFAPVKRKGKIGKIEAPSKKKTKKKGK